MNLPTAVINSASPRTRAVTIALEKTERLHHANFMMRSRMHWPIVFALTNWWLVLIVGSVAMIGAAWGLTRALSLPVMIHHAVLGSIE